MNKYLTSEDRSNNLHNDIFHLYRAACFALSFLFALIYLSLFVNYVCSFYGKIGVTTASSLLNNGMSVLIIGGLTVAFLFSAIKLIEYKSDFIYKYRWIIGISVAMLAVVFKVSGSSLGMWSIMLPENAGTPIWGIPRSLRSDEFSVGTLFQLSQSHNDYAPISEILRGDITDVRMVYGAACWSVISLFRPVLWGYLVFGFESGLAFAWSMKLCIMVLVSFDCAFLMIKSKPLSLLFSILLCFSPLIQWWGTGEVVLYGQALVLLLDKTLFTRKRSTRVIAIVAIAWLCGCYIMLMYPAWMVPFFYIFALMGVFRAIDYCRILKSGEYRSVLAWSISDTLTSIFCLLVSAGLVFFAFFQSSEAMASVVNTVYPGARFETGGSWLPELFSNALSLFYAFDTPLVSNECEIATILCFFPLGTLASLSCIIKKRDWHLIALLVLQLFFLLFAFVGFPSFLSRITLMYNVPVLRLLFPIGYLELLLFLISVKKAKEFQEANSQISSLLVLLVIGICLSSVFQIYILLSAKYLVARKLYLLMLILLCAVSCLLFSAFILGKNCIGLFVAFAICFGVIPGCCINPIQIGAAPLTETELASLVDQFADKDDYSVKWVVDGSWTVANLCAAYGAPVINSTNAYPDLARWNSIDDNNENEYAYNRYAHIIANVFTPSTSFNSTQDDLFTVNLTEDNLRQLNVKYVLSSRDLTEFSSDQLRITQLGSANGFVLYEITY